VGMVAVKLFRASRIVVAHFSDSHSGAWAPVGSVALIVAIGILILSIQRLRRRRRDA
jgi:uncharacterized membrane protein